MEMKRTATNYQDEEAECTEEDEYDSENDGHAVVENPNLIISVKHKNKTIQITANAAYQEEERANEEGFGTEEDQPEMQVTPKGRSQPAKKKN
jgi:hypothetical protein